MTHLSPRRLTNAEESQSAFVRGFIDDFTEIVSSPRVDSLNPRSCAASSMTYFLHTWKKANDYSLNPRSCAASSMTYVTFYNGEVKE